ncbi:hypothetical protein K438DRAFT_1709997 [Mycena galopus ATCC 62051]|nr:hypothetical protein K438DRAFT_1709997 [Mycena galopus ATCC 62051]
MRCIWSTTASNALRVFSPRTVALSYGGARFSRAAHQPSSPIPRHGFPTATRVSVTSAALSYSHVVASNSISVEEAVDAASESSTLPNLERPSRISFAAAQAIRMCIRNGGFADGFFVLNSIRYAAHRQKASALPFKMPGMLYSKSEFEAAALQFGPDVSQRLSAHVLLHGLLRNSLAEPAFELAKLMMAEGVVLRSTTMQAILEALISTGTPRSHVSRGFPFTRPDPSIPLTRAADVLVLRPSIMADQRTRFALKLLFLARRHRQRRTDAMFKLFLAASLLHGELIVFSLLFGWACRDWQTAYSLERNLEILPDDHELQSSDQVIVARRRLAHLQSEAIFPDRQSLESALAVIGTILSRDGEALTPTHDRLVALQALGNLAGLLDRRQIPFADISPLLSTLYKCPRVEDEIWIVGEGGCPERIKAHTYFHRVIFRLIHSLPTYLLSTGSAIRRRGTPPDAIVKNRRYSMLPPLDLAGYNALLHYALRHRLSPALAEAVLVHMTKKRWEPLSPDTVTANILVRSATLLRRYDIVTEVLEKNNLTYVLGIPPHPIPGVPDSPSSNNHIPLPPVQPIQNRTDIIVDRTRLGKILGRIRSEGLEIPRLPSEADVHTLTTYIAYLTSRGRQREVKKLLWTLFPELNTSKYPSNSEHPKDRALGRKGLLTSYRRAISMGPVFLSAVLNALYKSNQPILADRVWALAKKAERHSWLRKLLPNVKPWILGPQAYTVMLNCYGDLARRRNWRMVLRSQPLNGRTAIASVWGTLRYECQKLPQPFLPEQVRELMHSIMSQAALSVFRRFMNLRHDYALTPELSSWLAEKDIPKPDARFFNAALRAFRPRTPPMGKSWYRRQLRDAKFALDYKRVLSHHASWNGSLHEVAKNMLHAGFPLPPGLQPVFIGRLQDMDLPIVRRPDRGPFAYRPQKVHPWRRYRLHTPKEKGLPVSRAYPQFREVLSQRWKQRYSRKRQRRRRVVEQDEEGVDPKLQLL